MEKEFEVKTLKEIRGGKAFLIGADEHGDSRNSFAGMTTIKVTGEFKGKRSPDRVNPPGTLESLKEKMTAPSSFAKAREKSGWVETLMKVPDGFVCHRMPKETGTFPVHLFVEEFGQFLFDIGTIEVNEDDIMKTKELADGMSGAFPKEADREQQFHEWFRNFVASPLYKAGIDSSITDGSLIRGFKDQNYMFLNLEVKNEKGEGGGDPYMQNIAYYIKNLPARLDNQYPCFVLELCGTMFAISGIANTEFEPVASTAMET